MNKSNNELGARAQIMCNDYNNKTEIGYRKKVEVQKCQKWTKNTVKLSEKLKKTLTNVCDSDRVMHFLAEGHF